MKEWSPVFFNHDIRGQKSLEVGEHLHAIGTPIENMKIKLYLFIHYLYLLSSVRELLKAPILLQTAAGSASAPDNIFMTIFMSFCFVETETLP